MKASKMCVLSCVLAGIAGVNTLAAEFALVPVKATGTYTIVGNKIIMSGGQRVFLEIKVSGWDPDLDGTPKLKTWEADLDSTGYYSGAAGRLAPVSIPCTEEPDCIASLGGVCTYTGGSCLVNTGCPYHANGEVCRGAPCDYPTFVGGYCSPGFQSRGRLDGVLLKEIAAVDLATLDFRYGSTLSPSGSPITDPGTPGYGGTLVLEVPADARGTFTVGFFASSFMKSGTNEPIVPVNLTSAQIEIRCGTGADCDDGNVCTDDACVVGECVNTPNTAPCDDGVFCNGADTCGGGACSTHAGDPCAPNPCDEQSDQCMGGCPTGPVTFVDPQSGTIDARQPYPPTNAAQRQGINSIRVQGPAGIDDINCWRLCETRVDGTPNAITRIVDNGDGTLNVNLARTISIGAVTTLTYTENGGTRYQGVFTSHPANVDADSASSAVDILAIIDILNSVTPAPWGNYSCDVDQSGVCGPADILRVIDLLNGADQYDPWLGQARPQCGACCP